MSIQDLDKAISLIKEKGGGHFVGPRSLALVQSAEKYLGVKFPKSYREFLMQLGCGSIGGVEFYGIVDDDFENSSIPDGIWLTSHIRKTTDIGPEFILICDSIEGYYALNISQMNETGECPVVDVIPTVPKDQLEIVAPDFGKFFLDEIQEVLEDED